MIVPSIGVSLLPGDVAKARRGERGADGGDLSEPATGWAQATGNWRARGVREDVIGEFGRSMDDGEYRRRVGSSVGFEGLK